MISIRFMMIDTVFSMGQLGDVVGKLTLRGVKRRGIVAEWLD